MAAPSISTFGSQLRYWRRRRGLSQLRLATEADISARHLSFIETGRSKPSRDMVVHLAAVLDVPLRHCNTLLNAAGYAEAFPARDLSVPEMAPVARALRFLLDNHEPYPAVVIDRLWNLIMANGAIQRLIGFLDMPLAAADGTRPNLLKTFFDPNGLRPAIVNWETVAAGIIVRLQRETAAAGNDAEAVRLIGELLSYPGVPAQWQAFEPDAETDPMIAIDIEKNGNVLRFFTLISTFGTPNDVTLQELRTETMFPADADTDKFLRDLPVP